MSKLRVGLSAIVLTAGLFSSAPTTPSASAAAAGACQLVPVLRDFTVNQGVGTYRDLARGKDSLLKLFLSLPSCASRSAVIQMRGGSVAVKVGATTIGSVAATTPTPSTPYPQIAPYTGAPSLDAPGDPKWVIPGSVLQPAAFPDTFEATFVVTLNYATAPDGRSTPVAAPPITFTLSTYQGSTAFLRFRKANAPRLLVVPMGDLTKTTPEQFPAAARQAVEKGMLALSRLLPVQAGVGNLGSTVGGVRYAFNPTLLDLSRISGAYSPTTGRFCGGATNWNGIKAQLSQFLQAWNTANPSATADRVMGVVSSTISDGSAASCADGFAAFDSTAAWVRAVPDAGGAPSPTGALMAMELSHLIGLQPSPRSTTSHSKNIQSDGGTDRAYNVTFRAFVSNDKTALRFDTTTGPWNNDVTLFEREDYEYWQCKLGGLSNVECTTPSTPVGTSSGVGAGPHFVISGTTDLSPGGTRIVESYFAANVAPTEPDGDSELRLVFVDGGIDALNVGLHLFDGDSHHGDTAGTDSTSARPFFSASVPLADLGGAGSFDRVELRHGPTILYARDRNGRPVVSGTTAVAAGDPINLSADPALDDQAPALSPDGQLLAWATSVGESVGTVAVAPAGDLGSPASLGLGSRPRRIALSNGDIYTMNPDGSGTTLVMDDPAFARHPSWSPASDNSSHIVFTSTRDGDEEIFVMNADGTGVTQLTFNTVADRAPSWSPDGARIAFSREVSGTADSAEIFVMDASGGNEQDVIPIPNSVPDLDPVWAPDGTRIAFVRQFGVDDQRIRVVSLNGLGLRAFPDPAGSESGPTWSPDGRQIAYSGRIGATSHLYVIDAHENGLGTIRQLTSEANWNETVPSWSPDGATIMFVRVFLPPPSECPVRVCVTAGVLYPWRVPARGGAPVQVSSLSTSDSPAWSAGLGGVTGVAWSPDGIDLAIAHDGSLLTTQVLAGGALGVTGAAYSRIRAGVTALSGSVARVLAPASAAFGPTHMASDDEVFAFDERLNTRLSSPIAVDISDPDVNGGAPVGDLAGLSPASIPAGTVVDSYMIHANRSGAATINTASGSVTFEREILGLVVTHASLDASDAALGSPLTTYATGANRGIDLEIAGDDDVISLSEDRKTVTFTVEFSSATDQLRVITASAPAAFRPVWSPDGTAIAFDDGSDIFSFDFTQGVLRGIAGTAQVEQNPSWSRTAGDNRIVYERNGDLYAVDPATAAAPVLFTTQAYDPEFGDGRVAFARDGDIWSVATNGSDPLQHTSSAGTDRSPSLAAGRLVFERRFPLSVDVLIADLAIDSVAFGATDGDSLEADLTAQVLLTCGGLTYPLAVGVQPDALTETVAILQSNLDPTYACGNGTPELVTIVSDGVERSDPLDPGATSPAGGFVGGVKDPVAAIDSPAIGGANPATFLEWQSVPLGGQGYDPESRVLALGSHAWNVEGPSYPANPQVGTGPNIDLEGPAGGDFLPGIYTATLTVTDDGGQTASTTRTFRIIADGDGDGLDDQLEAANGGCIVADPDDPQKDAFLDADGDGIPNIDDTASANGPCVADVAADAGAPTVTVDDGVAGTRAVTENPASVPVEASDALLPDGAGGGLRGVVCLVDGDPAPVAPEVIWGSDAWSGSVEVAGVGPHAISCTATDLAWNDGSDGDDVLVTGGAAPVVTLSHTPPLSGWYQASPVSVAINASDDVALVSLSCTVDAVPANVTPSFAAGSSSYVGSLSVGGEGSHDVSCTVGDGATTDTDTTIVRVDSSGPGVSMVPTPLPNLAGWSKTSPMSVEISASDATSGLASLACLLDGSAATLVPAFVPGASYTGAISVSGSLAHEVSCSASDVAGNGGNGAVLAWIDTVNPTIGLQVSPDAPNGSNGWYTTAPTVTFSCSDGLSGLASCTADGQPANTRTLGESAAGQTVGGTAIDVAGNQATATSAALKVDLSNPVVTCTTPAPTFTRGASGASVTASVADSISGPASATASAPANTTTAGSFTVVVTGSDNAGRSGSATCPYTVTAPAGFTFTGFFAPIDNPPVVNTGRRQKVFAVPFQLRTSAGVVVSNPSAISSSVTNVITCASVASNPRDALETTTKLKAGTLTYSVATQQFTYAWSSDRKAGCYQLVISFSDGSSARALFDVK